jgi:hypothetical protein
MSILALNIDIQAVSVNSKNRTKNKINPNVADPF